MLLVKLRFCVIVEIRQVGNFAVVGVFEDLIGVHPKNVGHLIGNGGGLQLGPVFIPAGYLNLDFHIRVLFRVGVADGLHAVSLSHIPDLKGQMGLSVGGSAAGAAGKGGRYQNERRCK